MTKITGRCLCGELSYEAQLPAVMAGHCQCRDCQRMSGAGHSSNIAVPAGSVTFSGKMATHEKKADSGNTVTRGFCANCGSHLHALNSGMPQLEFLRAGSLDDPEQFKPGMVVYTASAASWDKVDSDLPSFETMPAM